MLNVTSDNSKVEIDTRAPEVLEVSLATDNDNSSWGQATDQLTMTIRTSEPVRDLDVTDLGLSSGLEGISVSKTDDDGMEWEAVATVGSSASGRVSFSLQVTDRAGNLVQFGQPDYRSELGGTRYREAESRKHHFGFE